jgi:predicted acyltransferase
MSAVTAAAPMGEVESARPARVPSVDLLRGADVLLMLFVNEVGEITGGPRFLLHTPPDQDGMTITDVVFPAFLFITGISIPLALGARLRRGEGRWAVWRHVLARTLSLLVLGVLMVNAIEEIDPHGIVSPALWNVLMSIAAILVWRAPARGEGAGWRGWLRYAGVALLVAVVFLYRAENQTGLIQLRPQWWGILGLIGWAYLVAATLYLLAGDRPAVLVGGMALLYCLYLADEAGQMLLSVRPVVNVGEMLGSQAAIVVSGVVLGVMIARGSPGRLIAPALGYAAALGAAGLMLHTLRDLHPVFWFHKNNATPAWCLLSAGWACAAWAGVHALVEKAGWRRWPRAFTVAGENALVAYLMAPLLLSAMAVVSAWTGTPNYYEVLGRTTAVGLVRSAIFAWLVVWLCGALRQRGVRMQL